jgi:hypothetical protein
LEHFDAQDRDAVVGEIELDEASEAAEGFRNLLDDVVRRREAREGSQQADQFGNRLK